jgi:6-phosphofructokinase 1
LLLSLERSRKSGKTSSIVVVSEGDKIGKNVFELSEYVTQNLPDYDTKVTVLGHIQRGGSPSCFDRVLASRLCVKAVELLLAGEKDVMVGMLNNQIEFCTLENALKGRHDINQDLLRISDILST